MKYGSYVTTQNMAYDGETGNVLLTQTHNEFDHPQYGFTYPAHFAYPEMGSEYTNIGAVVNAMVSGGTISCSPGPSTFFAPGDQVECISPGGYPVDSLLWVTQPQTGDPLVVIDQAGYPVTLYGGNTVQLKVIRSGYRNMPGTPIGSVQCMNSPIVGNNIVINSSSNILQARKII
jgi:hypothetical protein